MEQTFRDQDRTETEISSTGKVLQGGEERQYPQNISLKYRSSFHPSYLF